MSQDQVGTAWEICWQEFAQLSDREGPLPFAFYLTKLGAFLSDQCKEIGENNRMGKTRDLFKKIRNTKAMATHSSTLAWKIPWMEEPGRLQTMVSRRVRHDWVTSLSLFIFMHWRRKWQPTPVSLPGESQGRGSLVGCLSMGSHRVGHDWSDLATAAFRSHSWSGNWNPASGLLTSISPSAERRTQVTRTSFVC